MSVPEYFVTLQQKTQLTKLIHYETFITFVISYHSCGITSFRLQKAIN